MHFVVWEKFSRTPCPEAGHIKAGRSDVNFGGIDLPGVVPRVLLRKPILRFKTRGCKLLARTYLGIPRKGKSPKKGLGFIVTGLNV